jgi:hypothetical protein
MTRKDYDLALIDLWLNEGVSGLDLLPDIKPNAANSVEKNPGSLGGALEKQKKILKMPRQPACWTCWLNR